MFFYLTELTKKKGKMMKKLLSSIIVLIFATGFLMAFEETSNVPVENQKMISSTPTTITPLAPVEPIEPTTTTVTNIPTPPAAPQDTIATAEEQTQEAAIATESQVTTEMPPEIPKAPDLDPKLWDFLPDVVAKVGKKDITKEQFVEILEPQLKAASMMGQAINEEQCEALAKNMLPMYIKSEVVKQILEENGYKLTPELEEQAYDQFVETIKKRIPAGTGNIDIKQITDSFGIDIDMVKKEIAQGELTKQWIDEKIKPTIEVTDADVKKYYDENKDKFFKKPEKVVVSQFIMKPEADTPEAEANTKAEAEEILKAVNAGADFADTVTNTNDDNSVRNIVRNRTYYRRDNLSDLETEIFKLATEGDKKVNILTTSTNDNIYLVKVDEYDKGGYTPLDEELTDTIKDKLVTQELATKVEEAISKEEVKLTPINYLEDKTENTEKMPIPVPVTVEGK